MVEKAKALWYEWIPSWLPIVLGLCWVAMVYQKTNDRLDAIEKSQQVQETQIIAIQDYLRNNHAKIVSRNGKPVIESQQQEQDYADQPMPSIPQSQ